MRFFDTSFLVPLILPEATSEPVAGFFENLRVQEPGVSHWTGSSAARCLPARFVRAISMPRRHTPRGCGSKRWSTSPLSSCCRTAAIVIGREWLYRFETGLRAGDALHLAIASNRGADAIYSLDQLMIAAGKELGLPTGAGITLPGYGD